MSLKAENIEPSLVCPFTGKGLIELSKAELLQVNRQISDGILFFHHGAPVNVKLKKAFTTSSRTYIFPVFEEILFLKKVTAIVPKNRTKEPNKRTSQDSINEFYKEYGLGRKFKKDPADELNIQSNPISLEQLKDLSKLLPKSGKSFVSVVTHDIDSIHNLVFGRNFDQYIHMDFSFDRLRSVVGKLKKDTIYVLGDICDLPLKSDSVDAMFSFDYINKYEKEEQKETYEELKRSMLADGVSVLMYDKNLPLHAKSRYVSDQRAHKAMKVVTPWKKTKSSNFYFYPVGQDNNQEHLNFVMKTSLRSQFS